MTKFEKEFLLLCLESIDNIISSEDEIKRVVLIYSGTEKSEQIQSKITDSQSWSDDEKNELSAAVFEAIAHASGQLCTRARHTQEIKAATDLFKNQYLPLITENTDSDGRLTSVKRNIALIKTQISKESVPEPKYFSEVNNSTFFKVVTVLGLGAAAVVSLAFTK